MSGATVKHDPHTVAIARQIERDLRDSYGLGWSKLSAEQQENAIDGRVIGIVFAQLDSAPMAEVKTLVQGVRERLRERLVRQ